MEAPAGGGKVTSPDETQRATLVARLDGYLRLYDRQMSHQENT